MKIRLHEVETGCHDVQKSAAFYQSLLGVPAKLEQEGLCVMDSGIPGLDFNLSTHLPAGTIVFSFLTDDLAEIQRRLQEAGIAYEGPFSSHLGMTTLQFRDTDGHLVRVNAAGQDSPHWLQV